MNVRVMDLRPGMKVDYAGHTAICIGTLSPHPLYPQLWMVIWKLLDARLESGLSFDALNPLQVVGQKVYPDTDWCREQRLRMVLLNDREAARRVMNMESEGV